MSCDIFCNLYMNQDYEWKWMLPLVNAIVNLLYCIYCMHRLHHILLDCYKYLMV
jgi:hypothetical protein